MAAAMVVSAKMSPQEATLRFVVKMMEPLRERCDTTWNNALASSAGLGYVHLDQHSAELLFQILTEREERAAIAVAANAPFSEWSKTFTDPRLAAAVVDRITYRAHIIQTGTTSYRLNNR